MQSDQARSIDDVEALVADLPRLVRVRPIVELTGMSRTTIMQELASGRLRGMKLHRTAKSHWLIPRDELVRWLRSLRQGGEQ